MDYLIAIIVMVAGVGLVLFGKGVLAARAMGQEFNFWFFVCDNAQRLMLAGFGLPCFAIVMYLDPLGWAVLVDAITEHYSEYLGGFLKYGAPSIIGIAIGGLSLIAPSTTTKAKG